MIYPRAKLFGHYISRASILLIMVEGSLLWALAHILLATQSSAQAQGDTALSWFATSMAVVSVVILSSLGLYNRITIANINVMLIRFGIGLVFLSIFSYAMIKVYLLFVPLERFPPTFYFYLPLGVMLGIASLLCTRLLMIYLLDLDVLRQRIAFVGDRGHASRFQQSIASDQSLGFEIVAIVDPGGISEADGNGAQSWPFEDLVRNPSSFQPFLEEIAVDEVVVAEKDTSAIPIEAFIDCKSRGIRVSDYMTFVERELGRIDLAELDPNWLIFSSGFTESYINNLVQRTFDFVFSIIILVITAPVLLVTTVMIRLDSPGPILYRQERVGRDHETFTLLKFRSMSQDAESGSGPQWAGVNDNRVTDVGRFIRKTRIDELPQLFNVLSGHMSIIGPRPERPFFVSQLEQQIPHYRERHRVRPGVTGWAQINYPYGASVEDAREKLAYDLYYVKNKSLFLDIVILLQTVRVVLWPQGVR